MTTKTMSIKERNYLRRVYRLMSLELMARRLTASEHDAVDIDAQLAEIEALRP